MFYLESFSHVSLFQYIFLLMSHIPFLFEGCHKVDQKREDQGRARPGSYSQRNWNHVLTLPPTHHHHIWRYAITKTHHDGFLCVFGFVVCLSEVNFVSEPHVEWNVIPATRRVSISLCLRFRVWSRKSLCWRPMLGYISIDTLPYPISTAG